MRKCVGTPFSLFVGFVLMLLSGATSLAQVGDGPNPGPMVLQTDFGDLLATSTFTEDFSSITAVLSDKATGMVLTTGTVTNRETDALIQWEVPGKFINFYTFFKTELSLEHENHGIHFLWERYLDAEGAVEIQSPGVSPIMLLAYAEMETPAPGCPDSCDPAPCPERAGDGTCTGVPDVNCETRRCCLSHDVCYCKGGTGKDRAICDLSFYGCLKDEGQKVSALYYAGVRLFGNKWISGGRNRWRYKPTPPADCPPMHCTTANLCCVHYCDWKDEFGKLLHECEDVCCGCNHYQCLLPQCFSGGSDGP